MLALEVLHKIAPLTVSEDEPTELADDAADSDEDKDGEDEEEETSSDAFE